MTDRYIRKPRALKVCNKCLNKFTKANQSKLVRFQCLACDLPKQNLWGLIKKKFNFLFMTPNFPKQ